MNYAGIILTIIGLISIGEYAGIMGALFLKYFPGINSSSFSTTLKSSRFVPPHTITKIHVGYCSCKDLN